MDRLKKPKEFLKKLRLEDGDYQDSGMINHIADLLERYHNEQLLLYRESNCDVKPPLGLVPKWVRQKERYKEVCQAISRHYNSNIEIPTEWIEEYNELTKYC